MVIATVIYTQLVEVLLIALLGWMSVNNNTNCPDMIWHMQAMAFIIIVLVPLYSKILKLKL